MPLTPKMQHPSRLPSKRCESPSTSSVLTYSMKLNFCMHCRVIQPFHMSLHMAVCSILCTWQSLELLGSLDSEEVARQNGMDERIVAKMVVHLVSTIQVWLCKISLKQ